MSKHFRVWSKYGRIAAYEWLPKDDDITISAIRDREGWRVSALVKARDREEATTKAHAMWNEAGVGHLVTGDQAVAERSGEQS